MDSLFTSHDINPDIQAMLSTLTNGQNSPIYDIEPSNEEREASEKAFHLLKLNREYQSRLRQQIESIRRQRSELERRKQQLVCAYNDRQHVLQEEVAQFNINTKSVKALLPSSSSNGVTNTSNKLKKNETLNSNMVIRRSRKWSENERVLLGVAVRQQNHEFIATTRMLEGKSTGTWGFSLSDYEVESEHRFLSRIDWKRIAAGFLSNRTPAECMIRWVAHEHPLINKDEWSVEEDAMLRNIAKKHKERHWDVIALELKTNRTSWQCFKQYRSHLWEEQGRRKWTPEEDAILSQAVAMCGERNWQQVATCFDHRTGQQCLHRWTKTLKPGMRKGRWSPEEDEALKSAVALHGASNWVKVAAHVMERSDVQCRERWTNVLDPSISRGQWRPEEDARLIELVAKHGAHSWAAVAREIGIQRTDNHCWRRYKQLKAAGLVPRAILDNDRVEKQSKKTSRLKSSDIKINTVASTSTTATATTTTTTTTTTAAAIVPHKRKIDQVSDVPDKQQLPQREYIRMNGTLVAPSTWLPALGLNWPQPWAGPDLISEPPKRDTNDATSNSATTTSNETTTLARIPLLIDQDGRYLKSWITCTKRALIQIQEVQTTSNDTNILLRPPSEATGVSLARTLEYTNTVPDASPIPTIDDPELTARMTASPGLRQLRQRLKSLYKWPMLLGQIDVKMQ